MSSSFDADTLYNLLPAVYRMRDAEMGGPLRAIVDVIADSTLALEEDLSQLYDDQFIETCAEWVVPYIGNLIGVRGIYSVTPKTFSQRTQVANTIAYRRRKGTVAVLEELARDVTGWQCNAVEYFKQVVTNHHLMLLRQQTCTTDLRRSEPLERLDTPLNSLKHTVDVRRISSGRGRYNLPNIGLFLWRLRAYPAIDVTAMRVSSHRFLFSPLGNSIPLYNRPESETEIEHLAEPMNLPRRISRRDMHQNKNRDALYGEDKSMYVSIDDVGVDATEVVVCNLEDDGSNWAHAPKVKVGIDPELGRIAIPTDDVAPQKVTVRFHYGFSADMGGGSYERVLPSTVDTMVLRVPQDHATIQGALNALANRSGVVEITDSASYAENLNLNLSAGQNVAIRSANGQRPHLRLTDEWSIKGTTDSELTLNGLLISDDKLPVQKPAIRISDEMQEFRLQHCTLVPGRLLGISCEPLAPDEPSLVIEAAGAHVVVEHSIVGGVRTDDDVTISISNSIVDATSPDGVAYSALDGTGPGGSLEIMASTIIGKLHTVTMQMASNSIFFSQTTAADTWTAPITVARRQQGCIRYSFVPWESQVPRRHHCVPDSEARSAAIFPRFTTLRYGKPGYCQLTDRCPKEIWEGADDEAEMGAFNELCQPQRVTNLRVRLDEYLRFGLEAGIFFAS